MLDRIPAVGYLRVSGFGQREGDGPERQARAIEACVGRLGYQIEAHFVEVYTGTAPALERPAFVAMLQRVQNGTKTIVVERLDRLGRDMIIINQIIIWLASKGIDLIAADTATNVTQAYQQDPMQRALIQIQAVFAEFERTMLVRKLRLARERIVREKGKCSGVRGYGEEKPWATAELVALERRCIERIRELRAAGTTYREIAPLLNAEGYPTLKGGKWTPSAVHSIASGRMFRLLAGGSQ